MKVFKFGGASVKDAPSVENLARILAACSGESLIVVISAMGKMTNALEHTLAKVYTDPAGFRTAILPVRDFHFSLCTQLFPAGHTVFEEMEGIFRDMEVQAGLMTGKSYDEAYDRMVGFGEILSTRILSHFLKEKGILHSWLDARDVIATDGRYRRAGVDIESTYKRIREFWQSLSGSTPMVVTQGFIGRSQDGNSVTLGREGSDYSAALFAGALQAESITLWKDVPGVMNADPVLFPGAAPFSFVSYREAVELTFYGASVIHPKTIKPLENAGIPLYVKSFLHPSEPGTRIEDGQGTLPAVPSLIVKKGQILISLSNPDLSFVTSENLAHALGAFTRTGMPVRLLQYSALSLSVCSDDTGPETEILIRELQTHYQVKYNRNLTLVTIRHYGLDPSLTGEAISGREIILEQRSRITAQFVLI